MDSIFYNTLSVCFVSPIFYYFNPTYVVQRIKMWIELWKGESSKLTQREANALFMGPNVDMAQRYANTALLLFLTVFYSFPLPIMPVLAFFGTVFQYWLEKYLLLRRHRIPEQMGSMMAKTLSNSIPYVCFLYGLSLFVFTNIMSNGTNFVGLIAFILSIWFILVPVRMILAKWTPDVFRRDEMTYERHSMTFLTDYNRANPMTSKEAYMEYYDKLKEAGEIDSKKYEQHRNIFNNAGRFGGVINYGQGSNTLQTRVQNTYQGSVFGFLANQQVQSQNYGYHQMNVVPRRYVVKAIIPSNQVYTRGYYPVPNTSSSVYNYSNFISRAGVINANAAPNIQMKAQQATNIVYKSPQPAIQPTYAAPQRVNLAPK